MTREPIAPTVTAPTDRLRLSQSDARANEQAPSLTVNESTFGGICMAE